MRNPVPEKRVGLALLLIGGFCLLLYVVNSSATQQGDPATLLFFLGLVLIGWGLRERFKGWGAPPLPPKPPPKPASGGAPKPAAKGGGFSLPWGKKPAPPPPPKPAAPAPPPKPKGFLGKLDEAMKPKNKK